MSSSTHDIARKGEDLEDKFEPHEAYEPSSVWSRTFSSLAEREFAWFWGSSIAFSMALQMHMILFGFLAFDLTDSPRALGVVATAGALPTLIVGALGGALADRLDKRLLISLAQGGAAITLSVIVVLVIANVVAVWHLVVASLVLASLISINMPARQAVMPALIPRHKLMNAVSLQMGGMNLTAIIAPALAGFLAGPLGIGPVLAIAAGLFIVAVVSTLRLPAEGMVVERRQQTTMIEDLREAFGYISADPTLKLLLLLNMVMPMMVFPARQMLPVFAVDVFDAGTSGLGLLAASAGVGGLAGAIIAANLNDVPQKGRLMFAGGMVMAVFTLLFALMPRIELALVCLAISSSGQMVLMSTNNAVIQAILTPHMRGRVSAVTLMSFGVAPLAVLPIAVAAESFGAPATIAVAAAGMLAVLAAVFAGSQRLRSLQVDRLARSAMSEVQAAVLAAKEKSDALAGRQPVTEPDGIS